MDSATTDYIVNMIAAYIRRDRMLDALNTIQAYCMEQVIDKSVIHEINLACDDLRDAIVSAAELEVEECTGNYTTTH